MTRKVQVAFSASDLDRMEKCRAATGGSTLARVVRDALALALWVARAEADGWTLVAIKDERTREMVR